MEKMVLIPTDGREDLHYYVFEVMKEGHPSYGCFIGVAPQDILEIPEIKRLEVGTPLKVAEITEEEYVEVSEIIDELNAKKCEEDRLEYMRNYKSAS